MKLNTVNLRDAASNPGEETKKSTKFSTKAGFHIELKGDLIVIQKGVHLRIVHVSNMVDAEPIPEPLEAYQGPAVEPAAQAPKPSVKVSKATLKAAAGL